VALPENRLGFSEEMPLTPQDVTEEIIEQMYSRDNELAVLEAAMRGPATSPYRPYDPRKYLADRDREPEAIEQDLLFKEIMR
jgi:hypothetical protein